MIQIRGFIGEFSPWSKPSSTNNMHNHIHGRRHSQYCANFPKPFWTLHTLSNPCLYNPMSVHKVSMYPSIMCMHDCMYGAWCYDSVMFYSIVLCYDGSDVKCIIIQCYVSKYIKLLSSSVPSPPQGCWSVHEMHFDWRTSRWRMARGHVSSAEQTHIQRTERLIWRDFT